MSGRGLSWATLASAVVHAATLGAMALLPEAPPRRSPVVPVEIVALTPTDPPVARAPHAAGPAVTAGLLDQPGRALGVGPASSPGPPAAIRPAGAGRPRPEFDQPLLEPRPAAPRLVGEASLDFPPVTDAPGGPGLADVAWGAVGVHIPAAPPAVADGLLPVLSAGWRGGPVAAPATAPESGASSSRDSGNAGPAEAGRHGTSAARGVGGSSAGAGADSPGEEGQHGGSPGRAAASGEGEVTFARPLGGYQTRPRYPESARRAGIQGVTRLRFEVLATGRVGRVLVEESAGFEDLDRAAVEAVKTWRFQPARRGDRPVPVWVTLPVRFELKTP